MTFLTNLANILNFICQICKFFKQSSPTSQPSVAHRFIKILKSHTSICKTKSTPFLACTCLFFLYKSIARISPFITIGCGYPTLSVIPSVAWESSRQAQSNRVWVPRPFRHSERSVGIQPSGAIKSGVGAPPFPSFRA